MGDNPRPAALTASLLARKGSAAPSFAVQRPSIVPLHEVPPPEAAPVSEARQERARVVVVAADMLGRKLLRALIAAQGCEVAMFGPADSPIAHISRSRPDLVVIDLDIGWSAARDLAVRIKGDPRLRTTSVAAVIDPSIPSLLGYDVLLAKPLSGHEVARVVGRMAHAQTTTR